MLPPDKNDAALKAIAAAPAQRSPFIRKYSEDQPRDDHGRFGEGGGGGDSHGGSDPSGHGADGAQATVSEEHAALTAAGYSQTETRGTGSGNSPATQVYTRDAATHEEVRASAKEQGDRLKEQGYTREGSRVGSGTQYTTYTRGSSSVTTSYPKASYLPSQSQVFVTANNTADPNYTG